MLSRGSSSGQCVTVTSVRPIPFHCPGRDHVGVAGEDQIGTGAADARVEVLNRRGAGSSKRHAMDREARALQDGLDQCDRATLGRRHRRTTQQIAGEGDGFPFAGLAKFVPVRCRRWSDR